MYFFDTMCFKNVDKIVYLSLYRATLHNRE